MTFYCRGEWFKEIYDIVDNPKSGSLDIHMTKVCPPPVPASVPYKEEAHSHCFLQRD